MLLSLLTESPCSIHESHEFGILKWCSQSLTLNIECIWSSTFLQFPSSPPLSEHLVLNLIWQVTPGGSDGEESACKIGNLDSFSGLGRSPGEGNGNPLQYSGLENTMNRGAWQAAVHGITKKSNDWATNTFITNWGWEGSSILLTRLFKSLCPVRVCKSCFLLDRCLSARTQIAATEFLGWGEREGIPSIFS